MIWITSGEMQWNRTISIQDFENNDGLKSSYNEQLCYDEWDKIVWPTKQVYLASLRASWDCAIR